MAPTPLKAVRPPSARLARPEVFDLIRSSDCVTGPPPAVLQAAVFLTSGDVQTSENCVGDGAKNPRDGERRLLIMIKIARIGVIVRAATASACLISATTGALLSHAQDVPTWTAPRTPDGRPDLQGVWTNTSLTTLERSSQFKGPTLTPEEADTIARRTAERTAAGARPTDPTTGRPRKEGMLAAITMSISIAVRDWRLLKARSGPPGWSIRLMDVCRTLQKAGRYTRRISCGVARLSMGRKSVLSEKDVSSVTAQLPDLR